MSIHCPKCTKELTKGERGYLCSSCSFTLPYIYRGYRLSRTQIETLFKEGKTEWIPYFQKENGSPFTGRLVLKEDFSLKFEAKLVSWGSCPLCGERLYEFSRGAFCGSCEFKLWDEVAGKKLTSHQMMQLVTYKKTEKIHRFVSKETGKFFDAVLTLSANGKVEFERDISF